MEEELQFEEEEEVIGKSEQEIKFEKRIDPLERIRVKNLPYKLPAKLCEILDGFKWALHKKNQSAVVIVDGRSGMGKTTLSSQMGLYMSPNFSLDNIHFTPEEFLKALSVAQKGDTIVFDEAMLLSSRAALSAMNRMIVVAMSMIRSKNIFIIFNVNSIFDLDKNLALSRADLLLNCYGESLTDKGRVLAFFKGADGRDRIKDLYINGKKYYSYSNPRANFYTTFSSYFTVDEKEYEAKKQIGVNNFLKGTSKPISTKDKNARDRLIEYLYQNKDLLNLTQEKIADIAGIDRTTVIYSLKRGKETDLTGF